MSLRFLALALAFTLFAAAPALAADGPPAVATVEAGAFVLTPDAPFIRAALVVTGPDGTQLKRAFTAGQRIVLDPSDLDVPLADGFYLYDLVLLSPENADSDDGTQTQSGTFEVRHGHAVENEALAIFHSGTGAVDGFLCVGVECNDYTAASGRTLVLKEDSVQLVFEDDSDSPFPSNDWEITINDSSSNGDEYFQIRDITGNRNPFRIAAGAPTNSLWLDTQGDLGVGIDVADGPIHVRRSLDSWIRFETTASGGYEWDVLGNSTNFIIRDAPNNQLPFRMFPGTANGMLVVNPTGVGIGTNDGLGSVGVEKTLDVFGDALVRGDSLRVRGITATDRLIVGAEQFAGLPTDATVDVDGFSRFRDRVRIGGNLDLDGDFVTQGKIIGRGQLNFVGDYQASPAPVIRVYDNVANKVILYSYPNGNLVIGGTLIQTSDANQKENVVPVDPEMILSGVAEMPMATWQYIDDREGAVHLGPMAQDFRAAFGLGMNDTTIASVDADGVALASVQALLARSDADRSRIAQLEGALATVTDQNETLRARLARIEALLEGSNE